MLDPFCGTASTLLSCAVLGARTIGIEVDEKVLYGKVDGRAGIALNFEEVSMHSSLSSEATRHACVRGIVIPRPFAHASRP